MTRAISGKAADHRATSAAQSPSTWRRWVLPVILAASVALRLGTSVYLGENLEGDPGTADQVSYHTLALRLLQGHGFSFEDPWWPATRAGAPTAHWSYLYTGYLALIYAVLGPSPVAARLTQAALTGILMPLLSYALTRRLFGHRAGLVAAGLTAVYAYFIYYSAALMTEAWFLVAVLGCLLAAVALPGDSNMQTNGARSVARAILVGLGFAAAALLRQVVLLFFPFFVVWLWRTASPRHGRGWVVRHLALVVAAMAVVILPVTAFNAARFGRFVLLNTNAGFAFFWANHPIHGTRFQPILTSGGGDYGRLIPPELFELNEAELDQALLSRGLSFVVDDPLRYLRLSISRIQAYFMFWPSPDSSRISNMSRLGSFGVLWPVMLYGVALGLLRRYPDRRPAPPGAGLLLLFVFTYAGIHILSWALIRYRLPVDAVLLSFAGLGIVDMADRVRLRSRAAPSSDAVAVPARE